MICIFWGYMTGAKAVYTMPSQFVKKTFFRRRIERLFVEVLIKLRLFALKIVYIGTSEKASDSIKQRNGLWY
ncbi:MAG TPA: hypothetical protein DEQ54_04905 [Firmicutes bacterium]|jgi:hypothetical protein|nr:hypothetical protein [Bacillota bacterium]HCD41945.1 hypothetical protein [Bacillota bacterium]